MDQGTVWLAALGIAGTLAGALGGPMLQARSARRQQREQEAIEVRHRLRVDRQAAFAQFLDQGETVRQGLDRVVRLVLVETSEDRTEAWRTLNAALAAMRRMTMSVAVYGPARMGELAEAMHEASVAQADVFRMPDLEADQRAVQFSEATTRLQDLRREFIRRAQEAMAPPE
ncbi:hypothetical protein [Streptomyces umbrinus]|uniref:hypothetical protein n=1 Tax=Streptomyces umbrinus TaxID=67370 RepID=UPI003439473E